MKRRLLLLALLLGCLCLAMPAYGAKVEVRDDQLGFTFELPTGFQPSTPPAGTNAADVVETFTHPLVGGQGNLMVTVERLHRTLDSPQNPPPTGTTERWKSFKLPVARSTENALVVLRVQVPLLPEAVQISASGPAAKEKRVELTLHTLLASLNGTPSWAAPAAPAASVSHNVDSQSSASSAAKRDPVGFWLAVGIGAPLALLFGWAISVRVRRLPVAGRWLALAAGGGGILIFALTEQFSFGRDQGSALWGGMLLGVAMLAYGLHRFRSVPREDRAAALAAPPNTAFTRVMDLKTMSDAQIRRAGALFILIGVIGTYFCIMIPLQEAAQHKERITYHETGALFIPLLLGFGLAACIMGKGVATLSFREGEVRKQGLVFLIALGVLGVLLLLWLKMRLHDMGYQH